MFKLHLLHTGIQHLRTIEILSQTLSFLHNKLKSDELTGTILCLGMQTCM